MRHSLPMMRGRKGFTLLEVMIALAILVVSLAILMETQSNAAHMTLDAQRFVTATALSQEKFNEARLIVEEEGFTDVDIRENGDFDDFGDELMDLEFGDTLENFHWLYTVSEIDLDMAGDITGMAQEYGDSTGTTADASNATGGNTPSMDNIPGMGGDGLSEYLARYIRHVEVIVWWGVDDHEAAMETDDFVMLTGHVINPNGAVRQMGDQAEQTGLE